MNDQNETQNELSSGEHISRDPLSDEEKFDLATTLMAYTVPTTKYRTMAWLSAFICVLGLRRASEAVIIGSMLIAPLLGPIQAISFSIVNSKKKSILKLIRLLFITIILSIGVSILLTFLIGGTEMNAQIIARTQPNFTDLLIALSSGAVAFLALRYRDIIASVAGVAIAASLLPPLCVVGIGIALQDFAIIQGSFILFITNIASIIVIGIILCLFFGFSPNKEQENSFSRFLILGSLFFLISLCVFLLWNF